MKDMKSLKEALLNHCEKAGAHGVFVGKTHAALHAIYKALGDGDGRAEDHHKEIAKLHNQLVEAHANHAGDWATLGRALEDAPLPAVASEGNRGGRGSLHTGDLDGPKAFGNRDFSAVRDDGVFGAIPDNPNRERPTLVPRFGHPSEDEITAKLQGVPADLRKLVTRE